MTTSKPMTGEQLDELMTVAVRMQRDAEVDRNFPSANFAYAVQVAVLELRRTRDITSALAPVVPDGYALVPIIPTEDMIINGFEAELREEFRDPDAWEAYEAMSGCEQAALRAKWCWAAMVKAAPQQEDPKIKK